MFKNGKWMVILGALAILVGGWNLWSEYRKMAVSPFDVVDTEMGNQDFLPILVPLEEPPATILPEDYAPTLEDGHPRPGNLPLEEMDVRPPLTGLVPERIIIPSISLDAPIVPVHYRDIEFNGQIYHQWRVPAEFAAGWQDTSALLGVPGNTVLNGHHNAYGRVFENLAALRQGDMIQVKSGEWEYRYTVAAKLLLPERGQPLETRIENARWLATSTDERLTLVTCWPAESNSHRLIIIAYPIGRPVRLASQTAETP